MYLDTHLADTRYDTPILPYSDGLDICCSLYLTLDQQVVFSVARITGVANLPPKDVV